MYCVALAVLSDCIGWVHIYNIHLRRNTEKQVEIESTQRLYPDKSTGYISTFPFPLVLTSYLLIIGKVFTDYILCDATDQGPDVYTNFLCHSLV